jgi:glycosidase
MRPKPILFIFVLCALAFSGLREFRGKAHSAQANPPIAQKIEPPGWWIAHSIGSVQVMVRGQNLNQTALHTQASGITVQSSNASAAGDYLIAYISIDPVLAQPGSVTFSIDGAQGSAQFSFTLEALPDPGGRYQGFSPDDVIYLIMVDRFADGDASNDDPPQSAGFYDRNNPLFYHGGDLQGIIDHLQYIKDLGATAIWITPVYNNSDHAADYHGYSAVDFYSVEEHFGDLAKFREMVDRAHAMGLKVIQDQVANHSGPSHAWADSPPTPSFLNGTRQQHLNNTFDIVALTDPNAARSRVEATLRGWFANILPDINQDDAETSRYQIQNTLWWIGQTGIDGIREDTFPYVPRTFWSKWMAAIKKQHPQFTVVGEVFDGRPGVVSFFQGGAVRFDGIDSGLDTVFDFPSAFAIRDVFGQGQNSLSAVTDQDSTYQRPAVLVPFLGNHDLSRFASLTGATIEKEILAFSYLLTMRGTPEIYYGDEIGMQGGNDPDNRRDFPGGFPGDTRSAFTQTGRTNQEEQIFEAVRQLLGVRSAQPALRGGDMRFLREGDGIFVYLRTRDTCKALVAINNNADSASFKVKLPSGVFADGTSLTDSLGRNAAVTVTGRKLRLRLASLSAAVYTTS